VVNRLCDIDGPSLIVMTDVLGIDCGIGNIAIDSDGKSYRGVLTPFHLCFRRSSAYQSDPHR
jgi:hypothetical protein